MVGNSGVIYEEVLHSTVWTAIVQDNEHGVASVQNWRSTDWCVCLIIINSILVWWKRMLYLLFLLDSILCTDSICWDLYMRVVEFDSVILWGILTDNPGYKIYRIGLVMFCIFFVSTNPLKRPKPTLSWSYCQALCMHPKPDILYYSSVLLASFIVVQKLLKTHQYVTLLHWVTHSFIIMNMGTVVFFS